MPRLLQLHTIPTWSCANLIASSSRNKLHLSFRTDCLEQTNSTRILLTHAKPLLHKVMYQITSDKNEHIKHINRNEKSSIPGILLQTTPTVIGSLLTRKSSSRHLPRIHLLQIQPRTEEKYDQTPAKKWFHRFHWFILSTLSSILDESVEKKMHFTPSQVSNPITVLCRFFSIKYARQRKRPNKSSKSIFQRSFVV